MDKRERIKSEHIAKVNNASNPARKHNLTVLICRCL